MKAEQHRGSGWQRRAVARGDSQRVSIIVPTKDSARTLEACLRSARRQNHPDVEVVVVDNQSVDGTMDIARRLADIAVPGGPERSAQRNLGARLSSGQFLIFIDSDMVLEDNVTAEVAKCFRENPELGALVLPEFAFGDGFLARCRALEKQLYINDPNIEAARAFPRDVFHGIGGYDESLTGPEDYELPDRAVAGGWLVGRVAAAVWHDEGRIRLRAVLRKKRYYGKTVGLYIKQLRQHSYDVRPRRLGHWSLLRQPLVLLRRPNLAAGLALLKATELAGLLIGVGSVKLTPLLGRKR